MGMGADMHKPSPIDTVVLMHVRVSRRLDEEHGARFSEKNEILVAGLTQAAVALQINAENEERHTDLLLALRRLEGSA